MSPRRIIVIVFLALVALYALFQARFLILGPQVRVNDPKNGEILSDKRVTVAGTATHIVSISLDGRPIQVDTDGHFSERLLLPSGPSIIEIVAADRFGRKTDQRIEVVVSQ